MKLTTEEKQQLIKASNEEEWYSLVEDVKSRRNGIYPNYLAREILDIYDNKFPVDKYIEWEAIKEKMLSRKSFIGWLSVGWLAFAAATGGFFITKISSALKPSILPEGSAYLASTSINLGGLKLSVKNNKLSTLFTPLIKYVGLKFKVVLLPPPSSILTIWLVSTWVRVL